MARHLDGTTSVGELGISFIRTFPDPSIVLHDITITDSAYGRHHHPLLKAARVYAELNLLGLLGGLAVSGLRVEDGSACLYTDPTGYSNGYVLRPPDAAGPGAGRTPGKRSSLDHVDLVNFRMTVLNEKEHKLYDGLVHRLRVRISEGDASIHFSVRCAMLVHDLAFNTVKGSYLHEKDFKGNFDFRFDRHPGVLRFDSIDCTIGGSPFNLSGDFAILGTSRPFDLRLHTRRIPYTRALALLTSQVRSSVSVVAIDTSLDADAILQGQLNSGDPHVLVRWKVSDAHLVTPILDFDHASFQGYYNNQVSPDHPAGDANSEVHADHFFARWKQLPVQSDHIEIMNLSTSLLTCDLRSEFPVTEFNNFFQHHTILFTSGNAVVDVSYSGPLQENRSTNSVVNGNILFDQGDITYLPRNAELKNVHGRVSIRNSDVSIDSLSFTIFNEQVTMNAEARDLVTYLTSEPDKAVIDCHIRAPRLDLEPFVFLLKPRESHEGGGHPLHTLSSEVDNVLNRGSIRVGLQCDRLSYKKFEASDVQANMTLLPDRYVINKVSLVHSSGKIQFQGTLDNLRDNQHATDLTATLGDVDISRMFRAFNSFGQTAIQPQNIAGRLDANVSAQLVLDDAGNPDPGSVKSVIDFSLKNGALYHFEPLKKIQSFIFKNRDLDSLRFAELKDRFVIADRKVTIGKMEIESSAFSMYVEGVYGLDGPTDMTIQLPLRNLTKPADGKRPHNKGVDNGGLSFYIHATSDSTGKMQFKPELFHFLKKQR